MLAGVLIALLAVWAALSVLAQFPRFQRIRNNRLHLGLLPNWYLFTTPLLQSDLILEARPHGTAGPEAAWSALPVAPPKPWHTLLWNPNRRVQYAMLGMVERLVQLRLAGRRSVAPLSPAYRLLGSFAVRQLGQAPVQFRILSNASVLFVSGPVES